MHRIGRLINRQEHGVRELFSKQHELRLVGGSVKRLNPHGPGIAGGQEGEWVDERRELRPEILEKLKVAGTVIGPADSLFLNKGRGNRKPK
jgi:hypothetical protein